MDDRPIGVFDSGFGGLTVARALIDLLPDEQLVYVGDTGALSRTARARRGGAALQPSRSPTTSCDVENVKMVVVACNTAASVALDELRFSVDVPVVGVIEPGLRAAAPGDARPAASG